MPHSASAKKRLRQNALRRISNRANKNRLKTSYKKYIKALDTSAADAEKALPAYVSAIDVAARKNVIPKTRADRKKAKAALALQRLKAGKPHGLAVDAYRPSRRPK